MHMYLLAALTFALTASVIGYSKGRSGFGWFACGFIIGPFALIVAALPALAKAGLYRKCPRCGEVIRMEVVRCRFCKQELPPQIAGLLTAGELEAQQSPRVAADPGTEQTT